MCLAFPGKVIEIKDGKVKVDYGSEKREAIIAEENLKLGDYVLVQGGFAVQKVPKKDALERIEQWKKANE